MDSTVSYSLYTRDKIIHPSKIVQFDCEKILNLGQFRSKYIGYLDKKILYLDLVQVTYLNPIGYFGFMLWTLGKFDANYICDGICTQLFVNIL